MLLSYRIKVRVKVKISFRVWLVNGSAHVFAILFIIIICMELFARTHPCLTYTVFLLFSAL